MPMVAHRQGVTDEDPGAEGADAAEGAAGESPAVQVVRRWLEEGWGERNFDLIDELFVPEFTADGGPSGKTDRLGYKQYCHAVVEAVPDLYTEIEELLDGGIIVVSRVRTGGTHTGDVFGNAATGQRMDTTMTDVWRVENGRITHRHNAEYDTVSMREVLGFVPKFKRV